MWSTKRFIVAAAASSLPFMAIVNTPIGSSISNPAERHFEFSYLAKIPALPQDARILRIWIPLPQSDGYQSIEGLRMESAFAYVGHRDPQYGNEQLYLEIPAAKVAEPPEIRVRFHGVRREHRVRLDGILPRGQPHAPETALLRRFLEPDHRGPLQGAIGDLSAQVTQGLTDPLGKARANYNYVLANMRYDKSGTGWGNGYAIWACTAKRGNCTEFHSLFIGMMRAAGIPARFEIGFPLPPDRHSGAISGYHCWAEFYVESYGWIPVDASEAWKHPRKRDNFFRSQRRKSRAVHDRTGHPLRASATGMSPQLHLFLRGTGRKARCVNFGVFVPGPADLMAALIRAPPEALAFAFDAKRVDAGSGTYPNPIGPAPLDPIIGCFPDGQSEVGRSSFLEGPIPGPVGSRKQG